MILTFDISIELDRQAAQVGSFSVLEGWSDIGWLAGATRSPAGNGGKFRYILMLKLYLRNIDGHIDIRGPLTSGPLLL